jgi:hypothetical protein
MKIEYTTQIINTDNKGIASVDINEIINWSRKNNIPEYRIWVTCWDIESINEDETPDIICKLSLEEIIHDINKYGYFDAINYQS